MSGTGAVREHEQRVERVIALRRVQGGGYGCVGITGQLERNRHNKSL